MRWFRRLNEKRAKKAAKRARRVAVAGAAAVIAVGTGLNLSKALAAYTPDPHELPVVKDADEDLLANLEEQAIGYRVFKADQNRNDIPDGVDLAKRCAAIISRLPWDDEALPGQTYKWWMPQLGLETCDICAETVNMGPAGIVNPQLGISIYCPFIIIHYMEHGSFSYSGDVHGSDRVNVPLLLRALELRYPHEPDDPNDHRLGLDYVVGSEQLASDANDLDGDLLADSEEMATDLNLYNADQDRDLTPDGIELARQCARVIDELPIEGIDPIGEGQVYKEDWFQYGLERCQICGQCVNMGFWRIVNPNLGLSIDLYEIVWHYMSHGSFSYSGQEIEPPHDPFHYGRVDNPLLMRILEMPQQCGDLGTKYLPADTNEDCQVNLGDVAELADKWLDCTEPHEEGCIE